MNAMATAGVSSAVLIGLLGLAAPAGAATGATFLELGGSPPEASSVRLMHAVSFAPVDAETASFVPSANLLAASDQQARPVVFEYSDGYRTRLKIHKIASFATIPLFVAEGVIGQSLYNDPTSGKRTAHLWVATGIGVLFGVNTVTGVWNLAEGRKDPNGRARRMTHSILMLAADATFFATAMTGPGHHFRNPSEYDSSKSLHRSLAFTSVTLASAGYAMMFVWRH
jgi:hypothetical protein